MRILFAVHQFFPEHHAGTEVLTLGFAQELKARGHEPYVLAAKRSVPGSGIRPGETEDYEFGGIPVRQVGRPHEGLGRPYHLNYRNDVMARRAREYAGEVEPEIVHAMHLQGLSVSVIPAFKELGLPVVYTATDYWAICPVVDLRRHDGAMCEGPELEHCVRCIASRLRNSPFKGVADRTPGAVLEAAGRLSGTRLSRFSLPLRQVGDVRERPGHIMEKLGLLDRILAPTRLMRDLLASNGVAPEKIEVVRYGIDTKGIRKAPTHRSNQPPPLRIGFVGTLAPHKGCDILIRAFGSLPPESGATLSIHGNLDSSEPFVKELRRLAGNDGRIAFAGAFPPDEVGRVLSGIDVLVVPSRWYENAPVVAYEAFAAGVPVLATNLGGMSEVVEHEKNGLLFELEDEGDLAGQLRRLGEERGLLQRLRAGIGPVKTVGDSVDELEALYAGLVGERG